MFDIKQVFTFIKKKFTSKDFLIILGLIILFFITRLVNLEKLPIFCDEGIYIHWAKIAWHDASWRFISLTDGRQPLQTWATIPFLKLFPQNALLAGRLFSVASGFAALSGIFVLLFYLFGKPAAYMGSFLYIITPFFLFYDRIALADSAVNTGFIWILFFSMLLINTLRIDVALIFGMIAGLSMLTKSSVRVFLGLSLLAPILLFGKKNKNFILKTVNYLLLFVMVSGLAMIIYNVQRLSPFMHYIEQKNNTFVMTFSDFMKSPFSVFWHNLKTIPYYVFSEIGWLLGFTGLIGFVVLIKKNWQLGLYLAFWLITSYMGIALFSRVVFPRYLIFLATLFLISSTYLIVSLKNKLIKKIILAVLIIISAFYAYSFYFNLNLIPFSAIDRGQYVEGETAGWGVKEIMQYARERSKEKQVVILAEGDFGLITDMLNVYLKDDDKISLRGFWPLDEKTLIDNQKELKENLVYVVFSQRKTFPEYWPINLIKEYDKPGGKAAYYLFELTK